MHIPLYTYILISCLILRSIVYSYVNIRMTAFLPIYRLIRMITFHDLLLPMHASLECERARYYVIEVVRINTINLI